VFPRSDGGSFWRSVMRRAWTRTLDAAGVRRIRPYDLRHTFASLLVLAKKTPLYIALPMGHHSAGFTLDLRTFRVPSEGTACNPVPPADALQPLENRAACDPVQ
jgi:integrase